ncbi:uncharacterized protein PV09_00568 [Verruconis gallopava]|uniref:F-box domain-containing protein n=1 Tax=Verruconis gallopava TaxID=253628 RepID=A0A0D2BBD2_9PEZI|nr:uncharacterized protein PV09_00568 [Verruconis gallopava]KIW08609.1 hypothetical protein PV09_00568 [Verruconis gallopava]
MRDLFSKLSAYLSSLFPHSSSKMPLDTLPPEILLHIISYLEPLELARICRVNRRFYSLCNDAALWKQHVFAKSHAERRRLHNLDLMNSDTRYAPLLRAMLDMAGQLRQEPSALADERHASAEIERIRRASKERRRVMANWDPEYPGEKIMWREEFMQRHAEVTVDWFEGVGNTNTEEDYDKKGRVEVTGAGIFYTNDGEVADKIVGAMEDGSVRVWEAEEEGLRGRLIGRSRAGVLVGFTGKEEEHELERTKAHMTETGAVECVSVDSMTQRAYFGVLNQLVEIDLRTLREVSRETYPWPITALSEARYPTPMTVGTNMTLHMYDPRALKTGSVRPTSHSRVELIAGNPRHNFSMLHGNRNQSYATLAQPGPLSILHLPEDRAWDGNGSIWVAGRFTSLLNYDRRYFPKLRGHLHSGARLSCLRSIPNPFLPRELSLMTTNSLSEAEIADAKAIPGTTLLAAGEYKGKGSLELYGLSPDPTRTTLSSDYTGARTRSTSFLNRQTASSSKLLSVAPHGAKIVFSDGDGNVRWVERDGFSPVRTWNLNDLARGTNSADMRQDLRATYGTAMGLQEQTPEDIVQLLLPTRPKSTTAAHASRYGEDNLVIWTGEGKLGMLSFGRPKWEAITVEEHAESFENAQRRREEKEYDVEMGQVLRAHANELNFMRHLGLNAGGGNL